MVTVASCDKKGDDVFSRENDTLSVDCTEQSVEQNILSSGAWTSDCSEVDWITISPESGTGNGVDYDTFALNIEYNSGAERTGTVNLIHNGQKYPVTVTQGACNFAYGTPAVNGNVFRNTESEAFITLSYSGASGYESVEISGTVTGEGADGLKITTATLSDFDKGSGALSIPIEGTPTTLGKAVFEIFADGVSVGTCSTNVLGNADEVPKGLPVGWNFYALGLTTAEVRASSYNYSWTQEATNPATDPAPLNVHKILPTAGNTEAYLTASATIGAVGDYSFNPGIQIRGLMENDYFLFVIPVENIGPDTRISVEASMGGAGSGAGYYALEYSGDNSVWKLAEGSTSMTVFGATAQVHFQAPQSNASNPGRTSYDKATDEGYRKYTFPLTGINTIYDGNLYLRLRVCMDRRLIGSEATNAIAVAWEDLKGFEVALVEEDE